MPEHVVRRQRIGVAHTPEVVPPDRIECHTARLSNGRIVSITVSVSACRRDGDDIVTGEPITSDEEGEIARWLVLHYRADAHWPAHSLIDELKDFARSSDDTERFELTPGMANELLEGLTNAK